MPAGPRTRAGDAQPLPPRAPKGVTSGSRTHRGADGRPWDTAAFRGQRREQSGRWSDIQKGAGSGLEHGLWWGRGERGHLRTAGGWPWACVRCPRLPGAPPGPRVPRAVSWAGQPVPGCSPLSRGLPGVGPSPKAGARGRTSGLTTMLDRPPQGREGQHPKGQAEWSERTSQPVEHGSQPRWGLTSAVKRARSCGTRRPTGENRPAAREWF